MKQAIILTSALIILFSSCKNEQKEEKTAAKEQTQKLKTDEDLVQLLPAQIKNSGIEVGDFQNKEMHTTLKVNGVIDVPPENIVSISIPLGGYVKKMALIPGMKVGKGSVLATVEDQQYIQLQQDYLTAKSRLKFAEADYNRQKGLNATKATSDKLFQQSESEFSNQKILVRSLAEKIRLIGLNPSVLNENNISRAINIYAPISGYVTKVNVNTGKYVTSSDVLFELINPGALHVNLTVFENDASKLKEGQKIICTTNKHPEKKYTAIIHLITPNIGEDRTTSVHCDLKDYDKDLLPGTFMNASIELNNSSVTAVPEAAVVKWENKEYIFSAEGGNKFRMRKVETGVINNGFVEIKSALDVKSIVVKNAYAILMKMKNSEEEG
ncbi:cobalt-zinc-cadmium efflux system membrane fusion protein [Pedobacter cryoconitis]|uniref:efflux RND transporter periplasmic adaptor subunit n=1 Tax=Pedobacter cryoconitis TaxID=188932 RepID=UPI00160814B2|nr:efflux RND transporter periplasmic adaptor subunit [Pedobacter cryoconitis]MBB6270025.1 cobalt-zinc-cadmium efflux system membrane fusion protein [Pedobacter cryoconitis]